MNIQVLIAHAKGEEALAEQLAEPIRQAGYAVAHEGTVFVGDSVVAEASRLLGEGAPVILCGTVRAMGTKWARQVVNAARRNPGVRVFVVQMEEEADVDLVTFDATIARYWQDPDKAARDLIAALNRYYPLDADRRQALQRDDLETRYRDLLLKTYDIVDLAEMGDDDRHLATQDLKIRRLYVALRMRLEVPAGDAVTDATLEQLEQRRTTGWGWEGQGPSADENQKVSLGERLQAAKRLVVLGDPGAGKSTLLRWLTTAYLLRLKSDPNWQALPDIATLPDAPWLPVLIRCRDLPAGCGALDEMLLHSLRKAQLGEADCTGLGQLLRGKLERGEALLLVDGLDEITDPVARNRFAKDLEQIHRVFPAAPLVVTSRIVGYREMGYRIRSGFEHLTVADLSKEDKDEFAQRWSELTERSRPPAEAAADLMRDIHSSDRIERLTGNPMLLTTMALIKRKIGRLPQRRVELYEKAVEVLLNWRSDVDTPLDKREALPQLEYLAHAMCEQGTQQLREDEALSLLRQARVEYPNIHPMQQHTPEQFLSLLEARTGLLIQSGQVRHDGRSVPVYEFRHLTFQEYLAGMALVQGHYRNRDKEKDLAEVIAPLVGQMKAAKGRHGRDEIAVAENWREALRLCIAACNDDGVDAALLAVLNPLPGEEGTARPRAVQAALCLADEPNVSDAVAQAVTQALATQVIEGDASANIQTTMDRAATEIAASRWADELAERLLDEFFQREAEAREALGGLYGMVREVRAPKDESAFAQWLNAQAEASALADEREAAAFALTVMNLAYHDRNCQVPGMVDGLMEQLTGGPALAHATAWALWWMNGGHRFDPQSGWHPTPQQRTRLLAAAEDSAWHSVALIYLSQIFRNERTPQAVGVLPPHLPHVPVRTRQSIIEALGTIGDPRGLAAVEPYLHDADPSTRKAALGALAQHGPDEIDRQLLSEYLNAAPWLDPQEIIPEGRIAKAATKLNQPPQEIRTRYEALASRFGLKLEWRSPE